MKGRVASGPWSRAEMSRDPGDLRAGDISLWTEPLFEPGAV
jgi:hypothetical protein